MKTRLYQPSDYAVISPWWAGHGEHAAPEGVLPKCGVVVETEDGKLAAAAWLYMDNSVGVAWMSWLVSNPEFGPIKSAKSLNVLLGAIEGVSKELGYVFLNVITDKRSLKRWFPRKGFTASCETATAFLKVLS